MLDSYKGMTADQIEVRVWAFVVKAITTMVAPIDAIFLEILKAIAFMGVGTLGGISGRKAAGAVAESLADKPEDQNLAG